jgi:fructose-1,6-bisphosphatase/inositol monophosphatase family enzyme
MNYEREIHKALEIARKAGALALYHFDRAAPAEEKPDASPVTAADRECEKLIRGLLQESFAGDGILGEEGTQIPSRSGRRWIIDPIDGTRDFVRQNPFWSVQLAMQIDRQVVLGIIYCPCLDEMLYAVRGCGCFWNDNRVMASDIARLDKSILMVSGFKAAWDSWPSDAVRLLTQKCWTVRCYGGCYDVIMLARGKADIWLSGSGMEWDYAPVQVIAGECGARFLTKDGGNRIDAKHCLVCAPGIEMELREILGISIQNLTMSR